MAQLLAATAAAGLLLTPAFAAGERRASAVSLSFDPISAFTPASADPRLAAAFAGRAPSLTDFKFTPSTAKTRNSQVRVAIRARATSPTTVRTADIGATAASPVGAITPASYNLGVAVGWRRFAVSADVAQVKSGVPALGGRETAVVGVSYSLNKRLTGKVAVGADRADRESVANLRDPDNYSVDLGGAYALTKRIAVTGGVRYRVDSDRASALADDRRDSQAVYVGTAFKF